MAAAAAEVAAAGGGGEMVVVRLPPLSQDDPLFQDKKRILDSRNLSCLFQVPNSCSAADAFKVLDRMIQAARIAHMDELELYFTGDDDFGPLSTRNELESLNLLLKILNTLLLTANVGAMGVLQVLRDEILIRLRSLELEDNDQMVVQIRNQNMEDSLLKWGEQHGVKTKLQIAFFEGAGRGMVASENIDVGDIALEIPESSIISEELLCQSGMFLALKDLDSITTETMLLLWSIRERYNPSSKFKIYFEALPANFNTGLSFGIDALAALEGTLLFDELMQARQAIYCYGIVILILQITIQLHLRQQYDELFPMLCIKFPDIFKQDVSPHILNYGRVDKVTKSLKFPLSRPCKAGEQCFLSYGKHPGSHLITFYGFLPRDNPYDVIPLDLDTSVDEEDSSSPSVTTSQTSHMVRGTWLSRLRGPPTYGLPHRLVSHLHAILGCNQNESAPEADNKENDRMVLETLLSIFTPMLEGLGEPDDFDRENACWDVNLALDYKDLQRRIVLSIVTSCTSGLAMLDS
uniref:Rubisco LSMT substrate-binding domain-containing protein n=1 Tax=Oryza barthii TaxID=65489 RepID=A0A0D3GXX3_9ORYZ